MRNALFICLLFFTVQVSAQTVKAKRVPLKLSLEHQGKTPLTQLLTEKEWEELFPNRFGRGAKPLKPDNTDFYSFKAFVTAARLFPGFLSGDEVTQKRELAAFLANIAQETSGGWATAPGGYFKWGLYYVTELQTKTKSRYVDASDKKYPPVKGKSYIGRGPKQLSWNYNYGQFSEAWYGSKDSLLRHPDRLASDPVLSFASAIWFWMTPQDPKPSCHNIMVGNWKPTAHDIKEGRVPGFGATVNVINGGIECGTGKALEKTAYRYQYYQYFCKYFHVLPGENIDCNNQKPFDR